ncbi:MAG TPA: hypothetical protein VD906_00075 [Caulobacteraceae bacterium]|nr:hypothetical protein [Caulobacteraceae bacterium]
MSEFEELRSWSPTAAAAHAHSLKSAREAHAHMLKVAAARRLRALERAGVERLEDSDYWKQVAPSAVNKAKALRADPEFPPLP